MKRKLISLTLLGFSFAQNLGVPATWRKPSIAKDLSERVDISKKAIDLMITHLETNNGEFSGIGFWQSANAWSAVAAHDHLAGTTQYKNRVLSNLKKVFQLYNGYDRFNYNDDAMWWATAAVYAHCAYNDQEVLDHAISTWNRVSKFQISTANANSGSISGKSFKIEGKCNGKSMIGAVFWRPTETDQQINSVTTGLFLTLSAYLSEIKHDAKYKQAAELSASFIQHVMMNLDNIVLDNINGHDCSRHDWKFTYNDGKFIEGLSILTKADDKWRPVMLKVVAASTKSSPWQGADGIITEGKDATKNNNDSGFKAIFIRALRELYARDTDTTLRKLLRSYISVQYNALLDLASKGNAYSANWHGPPHNYTGWGQMAAVDVLAAVIHID